MCQKFSHFLIKKKKVQFKRENIYFEPQFQYIQSIVIWVQSINDIVEDSGRGKFKELWSLRQRQKGWTRNKKYTLLDQIPNDSTSSK